MSEASRRSFLAVAGSGAAVATVTLTTGRADAGTGSTGTPVEASVVAWIPNHRSDRLHLMVEDREVVVRDKALVRQILAAAGGN